jgi:hypothetical protein
MGGPTRPPIAEPAGACGPTADPSISEKRAGDPRHGNDHRDHQHRRQDPHDAVDAHGRRGYSCARSRRMNFRLTVIEFVSAELDGVGSVAGDGDGTGGATGSAITSSRNRRQLNVPRTVTNRSPMLVDENRVAAFSDFNPHDAPRLNHLKAPFNATTMTAPAERSVRRSRLHRNDGRSCRAGHRTEQVAAPPCCVAAQADGRAAGLCARRRAVPLPCRSRVALTRARSTNVQVISVAMA